MDTLKKHAVEAIGAIWLVIVAAQFLSRYFIPSLEGADFKFVYIGMLCLIIGLNILRWRQGRVG